MVTFTIPEEIKKFLEFTEKSTLEKKILDCGAGGSRPKIAIFRELGYETCGIEIAEEMIEKANDYAKQNKMDLNLIKGDMRELPFEDESFSFVYSYHTIMHLRKSDIEKAVKEMFRVLRKGGYLFVNFQSIDSTAKKWGEDIGDYEILNVEEKGKYDFEESFHSFHRDNEAEKYFKEHKILFKRKRSFTYQYKDQDCVSATIDYIVEKIR